MLLQQGADVLCRQLWVLMLGTMTRLGKHHHLRARNLADQRIPVRRRNARVVVAAWNQHRNLALCELLPTSRVRPLKPSPASRNA